jgi:superoxide dismutase, Fe-Mn family
MLYEASPLPFKPHRLAGLSTRLLVSHYENNYEGAVRRLNAIEHRLAGLDWAAHPGVRPERPWPRTPDCR